MVQGAVVACAVLGVICIVLASILFYTYRKAIKALFNGRLFTSAAANQSRRGSSNDTQLQEVVVQKQRAASTREVRLDIDPPAPFSPDVTKRSTTPHVTTEASVERISEQTIELDELGTPTIEIAPPEDVESQTSYDAYVDQVFALPSTQLQEMMVDPEMDVTSSSGEATITAGRNSPISEDDENHSTVILSRSEELPSLRFSDVFSGAILDKMNSEGHRQAFMPYQESFKHFSIIGDLEINSQALATSPSDQYTLKYTADLPEQSLQHHVNICPPAYDNVAYSKIDDEEDEIIQQVYERPLTVPSIYYSVPPEECEHYENLAYVPDLPQSPVEYSHISNVMVSEFSSTESLDGIDILTYSPDLPQSPVEYSHVWNTMTERFSSTESLDSVDVLKYTPNLPNEPIGMFVNIRRYSFSTTLTPIGSLTSEESEMDPHTYEVIEEEPIPHLVYHHDLPHQPLSDHVGLYYNSQHLKVSMHTTQTESVTSEDTEGYLKSYDVLTDQEIYEYSPASYTPEIYETLIYSHDLPQEPYESLLDKPLIDFSDEIPYEHVEVASTSSSYYEDYEILAYIPDLPLEPYYPIVEKQLIQFNETLYDVVPPSSSDEEYEEYDILAYVPDIPQQNLNLHVDVLPSVSHHIHRTVEVVEHPRIINHPIRIIDRPIEHTHATFDHTTPMPIQTLSYSSDLPSLPFHQQYHIYRPTERGVEHLTGSSPYLDQEPIVVRKPQELPENHLIESSSYAYESSLHKDAEDHLVTDEFTQRVSILDPIEEEPSQHIIDSSTYAIDLNEKVRLDVADILEEAANLDQAETVHNAALLESIREDRNPIHPISSFVLDQLALQDDFMRKYNALLRNSFELRYNNDFDLSLTPSASDNPDTTPSSLTSVKEVRYSDSTPFYSSVEPFSPNGDLLEELTRRNARLRGDLHSSSYVDDIGMRIPPVSFTSFNREPSAFDIIPKKTYSFGTGENYSEPLTTQENLSVQSSTNTEHTSKQSIDDMMLSSMKRSNISFGIGENVTVAHSTSGSSHISTTGQTSSVNLGPSIGKGIEISQPHSIGQGVSLPSIGQGVYIPPSYSQEVGTAEDSPPLNFSNFQWHSDTLQAIYDKELNADVYGDAPSGTTVRQQR